jgi:tripartite-type tricarboxylate transporter receptor subunit TctC
MNIRISRRLALSALAAGLATASGAANAQAAWPSRPVSIVVSFAAGGSSDVVARALAEKLQARIGQPVIVENKPGGNTMTATNYVLQAKPDGHVLYLASSQLAEKPYAAPSVAKYDPLADFTPISYVGRLMFALMVKPDLPAKTFAEFLELAKSRPGGLPMATVGTGGADHLALEILSQKTGAKFLVTPYRGSAPAMTDVAAGVVDARLGDYAGARPFIEGKRVRVLAIAEPKRAAGLDVPAMAETVPGFESSIWFGMFGPKNMPAQVADALSGHLAEIIRMPDIQARMKALNMEGISSTPAELSSIVARRAKDTAEIIKARNLKFED